jgi:OOP family OmpA-OmpF porin
MKSRNRSSTKAPFALKLSAAAALLAIMHMAPAAAVEGYVTSRYDHQPVRSGTGTCVHDYGWRPGMRFADCEPAPVQPVAAAAPQAAPEQEPPLAEAPPPAPQVAAVPVPYLLSVDELFDFDSASLKPEGRATLDALAARIGSSGYDSVAIVGHADRIGPAQYNQQLSERRAKVLGEYLVGQGIDAQRIVASGVGSSEPVTAKADCAGARGARLIQCLQPDRYADVTVGGTVVELVPTSDAQ